MTSRLLLLALLGLAAGAALAADGDREDRETSVASAVGVVVHGVDTGGIAGLLQTIDEAARDGRWDAVAGGLDALLAGDLTSLVEEAEGVYLRAHEAAVWRLASLPPEGLGAWRKIADPRAAALLASIDRPGSREVLERQARRLVLSSHGPQLVVALADRRLRDGDLAGAARLLEEVLLLRPDVARAGPADVIGRLAAVHAALGDAESILALRDSLTPETLAAPSATGRAVGGELDAAVAAARARRRVETPAGPLREVSYLPLGDRMGLRLADLRDTREILASGAVTQHRGRSVCLVRDLDPLRGTARLRAVTRGRPLTTSAGPSTLDVLWSWPSDEELMMRPRAAEASPFAPVFIDDLAIFCWPSWRELPADDGRHRIADRAPHDLVALSLDAEGRLEDVRGPEEARREDADADLAELSFAGPPLLVGRSVYVSLVGRSPNGGGTELHLARFDVRRPGSAQRLRLRWRHRLVDGHAVAPQLYQSSLRPELESPLALPTGLAERLGYVYVGTNTGAVLCVDGETGQPVWAETYERLGTRRTRPVIEGNPSGWKYGPAQIDGDRVVIAPRDAELLLVYSTLPLLKGRSARLDGFPVRGSGTATRKGSPLGDLLADDVAGARDGVVWIAGSVPTRRGDTFRWPPGPLVAYRVRPARDGEPTRRLRVPAIPELAAAGRPALAGDALYLPTYKAVYRVSLAAPEDEPETLYRLTVEPGRRTFPDRIGNLLPDGRLLWSVTPSRLVLFGPAGD